MTTSDRSRTLSATAPATASATEAASAVEEGARAVEAPANENRSTTPKSDAFRSQIMRGWAERDEPLPEARVSVPTAAAHRDAISARHRGARLVIPAGSLKQRSNDTDYRFRAHSAFSQLTGWGSDAEPGAVLVLDPVDDGHDATLYFRERAGRDSDEFYANSEIGEFWIGPRPSLAQTAADLDVAARDLAEFSELGLVTDARTLVLREADAALTARVDEARRTMSLPDAEFDELLADDALLAQDLSELRLVKDAYEIGQMREAVAATAAGFDDIVAALAQASAHPRGERIVEGVFQQRARLEGNDVGYDTIAASGSHACILHWTKNTGAVRAGELILVDAGVEVDSLFTADITRTIPVTGRFSEEQRLVYEIVLEAADAAFAIVRPGITFRTIHDTAMEVIAKRTQELGMPLGVGETDPAEQLYRRYMVHGTSHHLGIDVHDCAKARRELYLDGVLEAGMVFTIEPGLYLQPDDLTVPEQLRGIGVRIEDDILVTADGAENLSSAIPRTVADVESWFASLHGE
ncbi:aminopeptidase P family protein [Pseudoclavibacter terrae]|uniref:aminopeptidase P family protein n=1 Tax=Pseudoclavibacter terrae TaxID=1530195 RepID=UPI001FCA53BA|nr:aminopeptidase P family protein [Pseudoclavibacter terrae]